MRSNRAAALAWIGLSEGGFVNHPKDPGGATDRGITQRTFDAWNKRQGKEPRPVRGISKAEAEAILIAQYFEPVRFDDLPSGLDYAMADYSVNSGPSRAVKELQRILGVGVDGVMGAQTLSAIAARSLPKLIEDLCFARMEFLRRIPTFGTFGRGWRRRVMGNNDGFQVDDIGVIDRAGALARSSQEWQQIPQPKPAAGKAPEPDKEPSGGIAAVGGGAIVTALGGIFSALGDLHPAAQIAALGGLAIAAYVVWQMWRRGELRL